MDDGFTQEPALAPMLPHPLIVVAAAMIDPDGHCLVQQRPAGTHMAGLWEFPGGKVEPGESAEAALVRELDEELGIIVAPDACVPHSFATGVVGARPLILLLYVVRTWQGTPHAHQASALRVVDHATMAALPMPPADVPLVKALAPLMR